ncbi:MAG: DUF1656 domain-containing protein [Methyloprofundus sp.]|nr:DUF1656 domain-containing protein [Methyloprofundus sp.]
MNSMPHEFVIGGAYMPPLLIAAFLGFAATYVTIQLFNRYRLSRYFAYPPIVIMALIVIYTIFFGTFFIKG